MQQTVKPCRFDLNGKLAVYHTARQSMQQTLMAHL